MALGANTEKLAAQQESGKSTSFDVDAGASVTVIVDPPLGVGETATIQIDADLTGNFVNYLGGGAIQLNQARNSVNLIGPARFCVDKSVTEKLTSIRLQS